MLKPPGSLQLFQQALEKEKISLIVRKNDEGIAYGMTYIDHNTKCVFNGSAIGKDYSAKAVLEKCNEARNISPDSKSTKINDKGENEAAERYEQK